MKNNITITDVAKLFTDNGYINTSFGIAHYNTDNKSFEYVSELEVMEIFTRIYPNFERKHLSIDMIKKHLPVISDGDFHVYNLCKEIEDSNYIEEKFNQEVEKYLQINHDQKKHVPGQFPGDDFKSSIQFLINNNVFSNYESLYQYTDGDFKPFGLYEIKPLMKNHLTTSMSNKDYFKILAVAKFSLTNIDDLTEDIRIRNLIDILTKKDWKIYEKIINIEVKTMKTQRAGYKYPLKKEINKNDQ